MKTFRNMQGMILPKENNVASSMSQFDTFSQMNTICQFAHAIDIFLNKITNQKY